jgi:LysR family transcriptional regulator, glycine cleavage system transcriptional activator
MPNATPTYLIESELVSGSLQQLARAADDSGHNYYIATPLNELSSPAADFLAWIRRQVIRRV